MAEELASFTPLSETTYDPMKPRKLRGSGPKIPWERIGFLGGIAAVIILSWLARGLLQKRSPSSPIRSAYDEQAIPAARPRLRSIARGGLDRPRSCRARLSSAS